MSEAVPCKHCRAKIEYIMGPNGKNIPAQMVTMLYVQADDGTLRKVEQVVEPWGTCRGGPFFVNHFQTCPDAHKVKRSKKK